MARLIVACCLWFVVRGGSSVLAQTSQPAAAEVLKLSNDGFNAPVDAAVLREGGAPAVCLTSAVKRATDDFGTWASVDIANLRGKRVRFSAWVKVTEKLGNWAGIWLHVYDPGRTYAFDDMIGRGITGPTDWKRLEIVADVDLRATEMSVGPHLKGAGQIWMDGAQIEVVGKEVPTTDDSTNHLYTDLVANYSVSLDPNVMRNGHPTVRIQSSKGATGSWAWYGVYNHVPEPYLGHRIRVTCWIKSEKVSGSARVSVWAIEPDGKVTCIDNEAERKGIKGTTDWKKYEITAKVPGALKHLDPGLNLFGNGTIWVDELKYEGVMDEEGL